MWLPWNLLLFKKWLITVLTLVSWPNNECSLQPSLFVKNNYYSTAHSSLCWSGFLLCIWGLFWTWCKTGTFPGTALVEVRRTPKNGAVWSFGSVATTRQVGYSRNLKCVTLYDADHTAYWLKWRRLRFFGILLVGWSYGGMSPCEWCSRTNTAAVCYWMEIVLMWQYSYLANEKLNVFVSFINLFCFY